MIDTKYESMSDEQVVQSIHVGNSEALEHLIDRYKNFVKGKSRSYFLIGADHEDLVQEGMIGLFKAVRDFIPDKQSTFKAFAELCVTRQIITAIKSATRQKHMPLNSYVSLDKPVYDEESDRTLLDMITGTDVSDPEEMFINAENFQHLVGQLTQLLSAFERQVLTLYLNGRSYQEIAEDLGRPAKSIDNALQRMKKKLEKWLEQRQ